MLASCFFFLGEGGLVYLSREDRKGVERMNCCVGILMSRRCPAGANTGPRGLASNLEGESGYSLTVRQLLYSPATQDLGL